ncbi:MAG: hypothetical protein KJ787_08220 [Gammaproteobacteria bacterium]|nr:hypothetical protein [Gammaproteobacteria bacterium]MBU1646305.1 hypothetical protein [Gammaproteobacteria bacterium]MBU1970848.1 hypothetical protein [Gammaproteobacteria bacterium]
MYVVAIGWIYVTLLMAVTETNITAGILTFVLYGLAPLSLLLWLFGTPQRRRRIAARELAEAQEQTPGGEPGSVTDADEVVDQVVPGDDRADAQHDQGDLGDRRA